MSNYKINLKEQTATSINGITFKLTKITPGKYEGVCLNPKNIPPDDLGNVVSNRGRGLMKVRIRGFLPKQLFL